MRLLLGGSIEKINALGAGGRRFKSGTSHGNGYVRCRSGWSCCLVVHPEKKQGGGHLYLRNNRIDRNEDFYLLYLINS